MRKRVMFYCQHVLGMGHLVRSTEIIRSLARDFSVLFVVGGEIPDGFCLPDGIELLQLSPLKTDPDFANLQSCDSSSGLQHVKDARRQSLLHAFDQFQPDILVTELFPFGRKQFSFELLPLLQRAKERERTGKTLVVCSLRDILVARKNQKEYEQRVCNTVNCFYDLVLVHGDSRYQKLEETFLRAGELECPVVYTGYVVQEKSQTPVYASASLEASKKPIIVVSNGGGQVPSGHELLQSSLCAASFLRNSIPHQFYVFAGPFIPESAYQKLMRMAEHLPNVTLSRYTPSLPTYLKRSELSISMAGYNTIMDILSTGVRALVYPFAGDGEQEQTVRASKLAQLGVLDVLNKQQLTPERLARQIQKTLRGSPVRIPFNDQGAANSSLLLREHLAERSPVSRFNSQVPELQQAL